MTKKFCILKEKIHEVKRAIKGLAESGQVQKLIDMGTEERIEFFKTVLNSEDAVRFNKELEKSIASKRLTAIGDWMKKNLDEKYRKDEVSLLGRNFKNLDEVNAFIKGRTEALADKKLGTALTNEEAKKFTELGEKVYQAGIALGNDLGDLNGNWEKNLAFGKAQKAIDEFTQSLLPQSFWKSFVQRLGRSNMLASIKSPFLNIESNSIAAITEGIVRRFANWKFFGNVEKNVAKDYAKKARQFYKETGIDLSRMISFDDTVAGAGKKVGEEFAEGKFLKSYTDFIFNKTLSGPDVAFGNFAFVDTANIVASKMAKGDAKKATEIFKDATLLSPKTDAGKAVRLESIASARRATYTDDTWSSNFSLQVRDILNTIPGLGDILMPFVKTVANVAELGADYAGLGFVKGAYKGARLYVGLRKGEAVDRDAMRAVFSDITRAGLGMTAAYAIVSQIDPDDFIGAYDPQRTKINQLANTAYNAVRVDTPFGERWISLDYFGPLGPSIVGMLYAKKYDNGEGALRYVQGVGSKYVESMPINVSSLIESSESFDPEKPAKTLTVFKDKIVRDLTDTITARIVPGLSYDIAKAFDSVQRDTNSKKYVVSTPLADVNLDQLVSKIPYFHNTLPIKYDALGRVMIESTPLESLMFGARVRTARMDAVTDEILRLRSAEQTPNIKDLRYMYSTKVDELKEKTGDKFPEVARKYGETLAVEFEKEMKKESYKKKTDEEKKKALDDIGQVEYEKTLRRNGVKYR